MKRRLQTLGWLALALATIGLAVTIIKAIPWNRRNKAMDVLAMAVLLGVYLLMFDTFLAAFRHGDRVLVAVNDLGEKWGELVLLSGAGAFALWRFGIILFRGWK